MNKYYAILTDVGLAKLNAAQRTNNKVQLTHMLIGDGNGTPYSPTGHETSLKREVWRTTISEFVGESTNLVSIEAIIPADVGGWTIREAGVIDADGDLIAIANYQDTPKPILNSNGTTLDLTIKLLVEVNNSNNVTVTIDPNVANASRKFVEQKLEQKVEKSRNMSVNIWDYYHLYDAVRGSWSDAIDQAIADTEETGQSILFPPFVYYVHRTIMFGKNTKFIGSGQAGIGHAYSFTVLKLKDFSNCDLISINVSHFSGAIQNILLSGDYSYFSNTIKSTAGNGINIVPNTENGHTTVNQVNISNCTIEGFYGYGIKIPAKFWVCHFRDLDLRRNYTAGLYDNGSDNHFSSVNIYENALLGAYLFHSSGNQYVNTKIYLNGKYAVYDENSATGLILVNSSRDAVANIEIQQNYHNGMAIKNSRNIELVNITFDENGYVQTAQPSSTPANFKPYDLVIVDSSYCIRGSNFVFSCRQNNNLEAPILVKSGCRKIDILYDIYSDGTAHYNKEKVIETSAEVNVRSYTEEFDRFVEAGNTKLSNLNTDATLNTTFWDKPALATTSVSDGTLTMTATAANQSLFTKLPFNTGDVIFVRAEIEAPNNYPLFLMGYGYDADNTYGSLYRKQILGTGSFANYYAIGKASLTSTQFTLQFGRDENTTGYQQFKIRKIAIINVTKDFPDFNWSASDHEAQLIVRYIEKYGYPQSTIFIGDRAKLNHLLSQGGA